MPTSKVSFQGLFPFTHFDLKRVTDFNGKVTGRAENERTILQSYLQRFPQNRRIRPYHPELMNPDKGNVRSYKFRHEMHLNDWDHSALLKKLNYEKDVQERTAAHKATQLREHFLHQERETIKEGDRTQARLTKARFKHSADQALQTHYRFANLAAMESVRTQRVDAGDEAQRATQKGLFAKYNLTDGGVPNALVYQPGDYAEELLWLKQNRIAINPLAMESIGRLLAATGLQALMFQAEVQKSPSLADHQAGKSESNALKSVTKARSA